PALPPGRGEGSTGQERPAASSFDASHEKMTALEATPLPNLPRGKLRMSGWRESERNRDPCRNGLSVLHAGFEDVGARRGERGLLHLPDRRGAHRRANLGPHDLA